MEPNIELQQVIYSILKIQIQFGVYQHGDRLPTIKKHAGFFRYPPGQSAQPIKICKRRLYHNLPKSRCEGKGAVQHDGERTVCAVLFLLPQRRADRPEPFHAAAI